MTNKPTVKVHNVETGEIIEREMTAAELAIVEADQIRDAEIEAVKAEAVARRQALLEKLGITQEEAELLLK
jgi:hypothetical protein